ncbi:MAG TPA: M56 family metallopeptidase [Chitinophagaceae bacterium]|nr:M56 family metallopeptidase [Chitinophagaceae bacterium]
MSDIFQYLLKWSIALAVVFLFYRFALRPLTFYQWNRRYLIVYSLLAFLIPFVNLYTYMQPQRLQGIAIVQYIPAITINPGTGNPEAAQRSIDPLLIAGLVMLAGSLVLLARLAIQWYSLVRIRKNAVRLYHPHANVYHVDENVIPFSFGNAIFVNTSLHTEKELNDIILHEFVHVRQKHSFDIIWSEVLCILNWYNPFAWCIRHAIRQNLEFIADQAVLQHGLDKKTYQYHLLKVIGSPQYSIANNFNFSSLKKRIAMMNRLKSARLHLVKFLFALPLLAVLLVAFRAHNSESWRQPDAADTADTTKKPKRQQESVEIRLVHLKEFYKLNPSVKEVAWSDEDEIIIYRKNGQREAYNLHITQDMQEFRRRYSALPTIISKEVRLDKDVEIRDAPDPDEPVVDIQISDEAAGQLKLIARSDAHLKDLMKRHPEIETAMFHNGQLIVKKKDGTVENYTPSQKEDVKRFQERYGAPPPQPPPPPRVIKVVPSAPTLPEGVTSVETDNYVMKITRKDGVVETYDLKVSSQKAAAEKKYGEILVLDEIPVKVYEEIRADKSSVIEVPVKVKKADEARTSNIHVEAKSDVYNDETIVLNGVKVILDDEQAFTADSVVVHTGAREANGKIRSDIKPVFYINGKRSAEQNPELIMEASVASHAEIVTDVNVVVAHGEQANKAIINIITKENTHNVSAYISKESIRIIQDTKKQKEKEKPVNYR